MGVDVVFPHGCTQSHIRTLGGANEVIKRSTLMVLDGDVFSDEILWNGQNGSAVEMNGLWKRGSGQQLTRIHTHTHTRSAMNVYD